MLFSKASFILAQFNFSIVKRRVKGTFPEFVVIFEEDHPLYTQAGDVFCLEVFYSIMIT